MNEWLNEILKLCVREIFFWIVGFDLLELRHETEEEEDDG